jgi:hypothetical protein
MASSGSTSAGTSPDASSLGLSFEASDLAYLL